MMNRTSTLLFYSRQQISPFLCTELVSEAARIDQCPIACISLSSPDWRVKIFWGFLQGSMRAFRLSEVCSNYSLLTAYEGAFPDSLLLLALASAFFFSSASAWLNERAKKGQIHRTKPRQWFLHVPALLICPLPLGMSNLPPLSPHINEKKHKSLHYGKVPYLLHSFCLTLK